MVEYVEFNEKYKEQIIEFWIKICVEEYGFKQWEQNIRNMENYMYKQNGGNFWIALENENVIGTISLENSGNNIGILKSMYVAQEYRKNKIASYLIDILLDFAKQNGYTLIKLDTYKKFEAAIKFYEKIGFVERQQIGERHIYEKII